MYINQLNKIVNNYDKLKKIAANIVWLDINERHFYWHKRNDFCIDAHLYDFPRNYVKHNFKDAYVRAVFGQMGSDWEWEDDFWKIPISERKQLLANGRNWCYGDYLLYDYLKMEPVPEEEMINEIKWLCEIHSIENETAELILSYVKNAESIKIGGDYTTDVYISVKPNSILLTEIGTYD